MKDFKDYELVIGLEVHAELRTESKLFCACPTAFGAEPNTQCCPVCAGLPGAMPVLNRRAVELAVVAGVAMGCEISKVCRMDRKQYFYPDLPKAYQISQADDPICRNGVLTVETAEGTRRIGITRIHLEEDAGKLIHTDGVTLVDCNRCGVPLIEIVSEPDLRSGAEAAAYLRELRGVLLACGVSDCRMQEGSLRCDVNLSIRPMGERALGTRTEIKNLNSFSFVEKAIAVEARRQYEELRREGCVRQRTVRFLPALCKTEPMREKENAADYRFLQEPDLLPFRISEETVARLKRMLPELPAARRARLQAKYGVSKNDAAVLTQAVGLADYFEAAAKMSRYPKTVAAMLLTDLLRFCAEEPFRSPVSAQRLGELADMAGERSINSAVAKKLLLRLTERDFSPREVASRENLLQINDASLIRSWVDAVLAEETRSVADYLGGKRNAARALQGRLMTKSGGRVDPLMAERLLTEALERLEKERLRNV